MGKHCMNHGCTKEWSTFGIGDLYSLETHTGKEKRPQTAYFWLYPDCAKNFDLYLGESGTVGVCPRSAPIERIPSPEFDLRLVIRGVREESCPAICLPPLVARAGNEEQYLQPSPSEKTAPHARSFHKRIGQKAVLEMNHSLRKIG